MNKKNTSVKVKTNLVRLPNINDLTKEEFNGMMEIGYNQVKTGYGIPVEEAFNQIREVIYEK